MDWVSFEWYSLTSTWFYKEFCVIHFYFDVHICWNCNQLTPELPEEHDNKKLIIWHFGFYLKLLTNSSYLGPKMLKSCFKCQNEKKQISNFNRFRKTRHTKWLLFKTWFWTLEIGQNYMGFVCWRLLQKFQNEKPCYCTW